MGLALLQFGLVALLLVVVPGPDFAVVVPSAVRSRRAGIATALGVVSGLIVHAGVAAVGLAAVVLASDIAFSALKIGGATFLVALGVRSIWRSRRAAAATRESAPRPESAPAVKPVLSFRRGLLVNLLNPKAPLIYLSVMPEFLRPDLPTAPQLLAMSGLLVAVALCWYIGLSVLVATLRPLIEGAGTWIERATGAVLIVLGVRVALEARPA